MLFLNLHILTIYTIVALMKHLSELERQINKQVK